MTFHLKEKRKEKEERKRKEEREERERERERKRKRKKKKLVEKIDEEEQKYDHNKLKSIPQICKFVSLSFLLLFLLL